MCKEAWGSAREVRGKYGVWGNVEKCVGMWGEVKGNLGRNVEKWGEVWRV